MGRPRLRALAAGGRRRAWFIAAIVLAVAGTLAAVIGARAVDRSDLAKARLSFHSNSSEIASSLRLAIQHEEDLVLSASAFVASSPRRPGRAFGAWLESVRPLRRFPELQVVGLVQLFKADHVGAFVRYASSHPNFALGGDRGAGSRQPLEIDPPGRRPFYCLVVSGVKRSLDVAVPAGHDYCALAPLLLQTRDVGTAVYVPFPLGREEALAVETPVYRAHARLETVGERRHAFVGWLGELLTPHLVLARAIAGHPNIAVTFEYADSPTSQISFTSGHDEQGAQQASIDLHNGWTVKTSAPAPAAGLLRDRNALLPLLGGILLSVAMASLLLVLATSRERALALVDQKTRELYAKNEELSHLAMHDPLTGLPNRALAMDRATQLLAKIARQPDVRAAALFIDLDGFKEVNDQLGHAAGDHVLRTVAARLQSSVREQDTVARLGGDEFVVFVESPTDVAATRVLGTRLCTVLREPIELADGHLVETVTASIGIAEGRYVTPDALLRDADIALYTAKGGGKDRYAVFGPAGAVTRLTADVEAGSLDS
jgi:diguanylate cyclase (GGDEF)-like protein